MRSNFIFSLRSLLRDNYFKCMFTIERISVGKSRRSSTHSHASTHECIMCILIYTLHNGVKKPNTQHCCSRAYVDACVCVFVCTYKIIYTTRRGGCPDLRARSRQSRRIRIPSSSHHNERTIGLPFSDSLMLEYNYNYYRNPQLSVYY